MKFLENQNFIGIEKLTLGDILLLNMCCLPYPQSTEQRSDQLQVKSWPSIGTPLSHLPQLHLPASSSNILPLLFFKLSDFLL